jgi:hypothetical protein
MSLLGRAPPIDRATIDVRRRGVTDRLERAEPPQRTITGQHEILVASIGRVETDSRQRRMSLRRQHAGPEIHPLLDQVAGHPANRA